MSYSTEDIRNIAIVGHGGTGKTTLVERLLHLGGAIEKPELVSSGRTVSDYTEEEISHGFSIHTSLSHIFWKGHKINILDTPGAADFVGEVIEAFRAAESAVIMIDARSGVQIETIKHWRRLAQRNRPRIAFINKMDDNQANFENSLEDLRQKFDTHFIPVSIPMRVGDDKCEGVIDLLHMKAYFRSDDGKAEKPVNIPEKYVEMAQAAHEAMIEAAAVGDDELMEKYIAEEDLNLEEAIRGLTEGLRENKLVPVFCGSAEMGNGLSAFLDFLNTAAPSPLGLMETISDEEGNETPFPIDADGPTSIFTFKTTIDQFAGKLSFVKVVTGDLHPDMELINQSENKKEKIGKIYMAQGRKIEEADKLMAGDIGLLTKVGSEHTNDTLCSPERMVHFRPLRLPQPVYAVAIHIESKKDEDKAGQFLHRATEEDMTLKLTFNKETKETILAGMGEMHVNLLLERLLKQNKIAVDTTTPKVAYRETLTKTASATYRHKKQTGGHGQFGEVLIEVSPGERGSYYSFENNIHGGSVSKGYIPGIEKGLHEGMEEGVLAHYPVVDVAVKLLDGKEHPVDSSELAFKLAARNALKEALEQAKCTLLEPVVDLHVFIEEQYLGDVLSDLSSRRGRVMGQEDLGGGIMEVQALVPQAELLKYAIELKAMTSGTGSFELSFSSYEPISGKVADDVIKARKQELEEPHK